MLRPPNGQGGIELDKFHTPQAVRHGPVDAPVNALGIRRVMFAVDDIDDLVARMRAHGAKLIGEMQYEDAYRLAYIRGPEGIIVGLAEEIRKASPRTGRKTARPKSVTRAMPAGRKTSAPKGGKARNR
jgi:hypothetical protein